MSDMHLAGRGARRHGGRWLAQGLHELPQCVQDVHFGRISHVSAAPALLGRCTPRPARCQRSNQIAHG